MWHAKTGRPSLVVLIATDRTATNRMETAMLQDWDQPSSMDIGLECDVKGRRIIVSGLESAYKGP